MRKILMLVATVGTVALAGCQQQEAAPPAETTTEVAPSEGTMAAPADDAAAAPAEGEAPAPAEGTAAPAEDAAPAEAGQSSGGNRI